jgi:hypothetical protein
MIFYLITSMKQFAGKVDGHQATFYIHNKCPFPIWPATAPNTGQPIIANGGFYLPSSQTKKIIAPWSWSWSWDCDGKLACNGAIGTPLATLVEYIFFDKRIHYSMTHITLENSTTMT